MCVDFPRQLCVEQDHVFMTIAHFLSHIPFTVSHSRTMDVKKLHMISPEDLTDYKNYAYALSGTAGTERPVKTFNSIPTTILNRSH